MRRALLAIAASLPAAALAAPTAADHQVIDPDNYDVTTVTSYVNAAACATSGTATLEWKIPGATTGVSSNYQIFSTNSDPATRGSPDTNFCFEAPDTSRGIAAGLVTSTPVSAETQQLAVSGTAIVTPAGKTCSAASESLIVFVCAHWYVGATRSGWANGKLIIQVNPAPKPTGVTVQSGDGRLIVGWTPGTPASGEAASDHYLVTATGPTPGDVHTTTVESGSVATAVVSGLQNGVTYSVVVEAFSIGGNGSGVSDPPVTGTPMHVADFWEYYKAQGGREAGGCASGPAGALALLGAAALLAARRRR